VSKEALRQKIRQEQALHGEPERKLDSARICALIREQPVWKSSRSVLFFWPLATEPDLRPLCQEAIGSGKIVAFPNTCPPAPVMRLCGSRISRPGWSRASSESSNRPRLTPNFG